MSVNLRVLSDLIRHDKADRKFYRSENLITYDKPVHLSGSKESYTNFGMVDSTLVMRYLGLDAAVSQCRQAVGNVKPRKDGYCYRYNSGATSAHSAKIVAMLHINSQTARSLKKAKRQLARPQSEETMMMMPWGNTGTVRLNLVYCQTLEMLVQLASCVRM